MFTATVYERLAVLTDGASAALAGEKEMVAVKK
jgi:hypothetical protein